MDIKIKSYNSHALNSGNYRTVINESSPLFGNATSDEVERSGFWPVRGAKKYRGNVMLLDVTVYSGTIADGIDQIGEWFNEEDTGIYDLLIQDVNDSNKEWYVKAEPLGILRFKGALITVALHVPEPIWKTNTAQSDSWSISSSGATRNLSVVGNRNARPVYTITATSARTGGYGYMRYVAIANRTTRIYKDAINLPDSDWNTSALVAGSKMQSDGDDLRVFNDETGTEEFCWFGGGGINTTTTRLFSNVVLSPKIELTLSGSISSVGTVSTITVKSTSANRTALKSLSTEPYKFIAIDMGSGTFEIFKYTGVSVSSYQITGVTRAQKNTSNQSHSDGATIRHIHGYYVMYGNSSASAPSTDNSFKPIIDLANSTNTSHVYASFYDSLYPTRTCMWVPQIIKNVGNESELYTATQDTFSDTASVIGQAIKVYKVGNANRAPLADLVWSLYHPAGITTLTWSGYKYRFGNSWPGTAGVDKSNDGKHWSLVASESRPSSSGSWGALSSHSSVSLSGTYLNIRSRFYGSVAAITGNYSAMEITDLTATLDSSNVPLISFGSEQSNNYMDFRLTNNTTGQWIEVSCSTPLNTALTIDTDNLTISLADGTVPLIRLDDESRADWLPLLPNQTNQLAYTETGVNAVTLVTSWRDRNA